MIQNPDKFGYYKSGNTISYSKYEALQAGPTTWHFNDELFSAFDWKHEPEGDIWDMYKERCRQIRSQYDYCVLWYSGGSDSHNILQAWIAADCKIDEIATTWNYETTGEYYNHQNAEITNVVLPDVEQLKKEGYSFKFRALDIPTIGLQAFPTFKNDLEYYFNFNFQISSVGKQLIRDVVPDYKNIIASGKKMVFIWGKEKPNLFYDNGKYSFCFSDSIDDCVGPYSQRKYKQGWFDELFYWSPDAPLLAIKAAHIVKNYVRVSTDPGAFRKNPFKFFGAAYSPTMNGYLRNEVLKTLLCPKWSNRIFSNNKSPRRILGWRDDWFREQDTVELHRAKAAIRNYIHLTRQDNLNALNPMYGKRYELE